MFNQPFAGGWRFGDRPSSVDALYKAQTPDNDFLKRVAAMAQGQDPAKTVGLLDQQLQAQPLSGLLDAPGSAGWGNDQDRGGGGQGGGPSRGPQSLSDGGNPQTMASAAGFNPNMGAAMKGMLTGGPVAAVLGGLLGGSKTAPVYDLVMPGMNGYFGNDYGTSSTLNGAPNAQQAQAIADQFARDMMGYQTGGDGFGSAGGSFGGAGGFGAGDYGDGTDR